MKNKTKIFFATLLLFLTATIFINDNFFLVQAKEEKEMITDKQWKGKFLLPAKGSLESTGTDNFIIDMESVGDWENQVIASLDEINLKEGQTYIYSADLLSEKTNRTNLFFGLYDSDNYDDTNNKIWGDFNVTLTENNVYHLYKMIKVNKDYNNASIVYKLGRNGYEANTNFSNKITVKNSKFINIKDIDYSKLEYSPLAETTTYKNYSYSKIGNIDVIQTETRTDLGKDTLCINVTTAGIAKDSNNNYKVYLNDIQTQPVIVEANVWYHFDYANLIYEYNILKSIDEFGQEAIVVIKNKNVTEYKSNILNEISKYEKPSNSAGVNEVINSYKQKIESAKTIDEVDKLYNELPDKIKLQEQKDIAIDELKKIIGNDYSNQIEQIFKNAVNKINNSKTEEDIKNSLEVAKKDINKQLDIEKENEKNNSKTENAIINNPQTYDNIFIYVILLLITTFGLVYAIRKYKKTKRVNR